MRKNLIAAALLLSLSVPVVAQNYQAGDVLVRGGLTSVQPDSNKAGVYVDALGGDTALSVSVDNNSQLGLNLVYFFDSNWAVELLAATPFSHDITVHDSDPVNTSEAVFGVNVDGVTLAEVKHLPPTLSALYYFNTESSFKPYLGAGINYTVFFDEEFKSTPKSLGFNDLELDGSFGYALQVGADYQLNKNWHINVSARYIDIATEANFKIGSTIKGSSDVDVDPMVYSVMVGYQF